VEANPTQLINYFSGFKQNMVPLFQRPYTWGEKQWKTLWEDIVDFYDLDPADQRSTHFMGAIVTMPARSVPVWVSKFLVIDGQQRLTTIAILMSAIRDALNPSEPAYRRVQTHYLTNEGYPGTDHLKLLPTQADRFSFAPIMENPGVEMPASSFRKAYEYFRSRFKTLSENESGNISQRLLQIVESRLMVVMINLSDTDDPYLIFESLNFKGSPLEQADLVRNYFLMRFPVNEQQLVYDELWLPMQTRLGPSLTEFMRHARGAEGEEVRKGDVYAAIKRVLGDRDTGSVRLAVQRMSSLSVLYARILGAQSEPETSLEAYFDRFRRLDFTSVYPLLLSFYEDYEDQQFELAEFVATLRVLESFIVRRMIVGVPSNQLSGVFITLAKNKPETDKPSSWLAMTLASETKNRRWPEDAEFQASWLGSSVYGNRVCQVVLEVLEKSFEHHEQASFEEATVEHVLPQTLTPEWLDALGPDAEAAHARLVHTFGNLTLTGYNPALSNNPFFQKQTLLATSHFELNRWIANCSKWGSEEIRLRGEQLFSRALSLWPRPPSIPTVSQQGRKRSASFHAECIRMAEYKLNSVLVKLSQKRYQSGDGSVRLVCAVSTVHGEDSAVPYFWFGVHPAEIEFLEGSKSAFFCFGCGSSEKTLLLRQAEVQKRRNEMSRSARGHWHFVVDVIEGNLEFRPISQGHRSDLSEYLVSS
jgi:hypothetical protein